ncbi:hypothetical protein HS5_19410 [Acidianus sp. HS-5]|nr:hypothetical protein HS5_19410 [Acidianus sp. HS-5]
MGSIEKCGVILDGVFYEINNISSSPFEFVMDPEEFYSVIKKGELQAIVHTHNKSCEPSKFDIESMKIWKVYWIIISKDCLMVYKYSNFGIVKVDINSLPFKILDNLFVKLFK